MLLIIENKLHNVKPLQGINEGSYGKCYKYNDDSVLKVFFNSNCFKEKGKIIENNIINSLGVKIEDVSFPMEILNVFGYKFSYIMPFISGINMDEVTKKILYENYDVTFDEIKTLYDDALKKIEEITDYGFKTNDIMMRNCKVKNDFSFGLVDIDFFKKQKEIKNNIFDSNLYNINQLFYLFFIDIYNNKKYISAGTKYYDNIKKNADEDLNELGGINLHNNKHYVDDVLFQINEKMKVNTVGKLIYKKV